jgi:hypothetical protein
MGYYAFSRPKPPKDSDTTDGANCAGEGETTKKKRARKEKAAPSTTVLNERKDDSACPKEKGAAAAKTPKQVRVDDSDCKNFGKWVRIPIKEKGDLEERNWLGRIKAVGVVGGVEKYSVYFEEDGDYLDYEVDEVLNLCFFSCANVTRVSLRGAV